MDDLESFHALIQSKYEACVPAEHNEEEAHAFLYAPQIRAAAEVLHHFRLAREGRGGAMWTILCALMQSGKTGVMQTVAWLCSRPKMLRCVLGDMVDVGNVYVITGMNSTDWKRQTLKRMAQSGNLDETQVLHNADLKALTSAWKKGKQLRRKERMSRRAMFFWDEAHFGQDLDSVVATFWKALGVPGDGNPDAFRGERSVYVCSVSATPMSEIKDNDATRFKAIVQLQAGEGYVTPEMMLTTGRVCASWSLKDAEGVEQLLDTAVAKLRDFPTGMYAIVRAADKVQKLLELAIDERSTTLDGVALDYVHYDAASTKLDLNEHLLRPPGRDRVQFVLVKAQLRAAVTVPLQHVAIMFDTEFTKVDTAAQSLFGRALGYRKAEEQRTIVYCDIASVRAYAVWPEQGFAADATPGNAKNMVNAKTVLEHNVPVLLTMDPATVRQFDGRRDNLQAMHAWLSEQRLEGLAPDVYSVERLFTVQVMRTGTAAQTVRASFDKAIEASRAGRAYYGPGKAHRWQAVVDARPGMPTFGTVVITCAGGWSARMPTTNNREMFAPGSLH